MNPIPSSSKPAQNTTFSSAFPLLNFCLFYGSNRAQGASYGTCTPSSGTVPRSNSALSQNSGNSTMSLDAEASHFDMTHLKDERGNRI